MAVPNRIVTDWHAASLARIEREHTRALKAKCRAVERDAKLIRTLSLPDQMAVALILDRTDLLPHPCAAPLDAVAALGIVALQRAVAIRREGWQTA